MHTEVQCNFQNCYAKYANVYSLKKHNMRDHLSKNALQTLNKLWLWDNIGAYVENQVPYNINFPHNITLPDLNNMLVLKSNEDPNVLEAKNMSIQVLQEKSKLRNTSFFDKFICLWFDE